MSEKPMSVNTSNDLLIGVGTNLPNSSYAAEGLATFVTIMRPGGYPVFRTKQAAYRVAAWLVALADVLPDEELPSAFDEVLNAVRDT